ncbi:MAG: dTDP-glucose 4,6-dehydratase [Rickettsiales bacterium]|nr:dTDP-glucose 4,6-dehydratase [Rickettsiales bacterium]
MAEPKTLLVTGGAGFIGSCFVSQCIARGQKVIVLDKLTYAGHRANLAHVANGPCELIVGDICDGPLVAQLLQEHAVDALVHFAAESHVDNSIESPGEFITTNILGTYALLEAARQYAPTRSDFRFLQVSTDEVYGTLEDDGFFTEDRAKQPNSPYSASKAAGDHLARAWFHTYGLPVITTNCSNNYGPRQYPEKLIPLMIRHALAGKPLPVYGEGKNIRDWIHVEDHCHGVYLALTKGQLGETYLFGGRSERRNLQVVEAICDMLSELRPGPDYCSLITFVTDRAGHDWRYAIDDSKAEAELGFRRTYQQFEDGLRATIAWYLDNDAWCQEVTEEKEA